MILQGKDGFWGIKDPSTTETQGRVFGQWFFVLAGKAALILHAEPIYFYLILQAMGGLFVCIMTYIFITMLLPELYQCIAILLALGMEIGPDFGTWKASLDGSVATFRIFDLAHHTWGEALGLLSLYLLIRAYKKITPFRLFGLFVSSLFSTAFLPTVMMTLGLLVYPAFLIWSFVTRTFKKLFIPIAVASAAVILAAIQTKIAFTQAGFPWSQWSEIEKTWWVSSQILIQYLESLSVYLPFVVLGLIALPIRWKYLSSDTKLVLILLTCWVVVPILYIPISDKSFFPVANLRLVDGTLYISAGIVSAIALVEFLNLFRNIRIRTVLKTVIVSATIGISVLLSATYLIPFIRSQADGDPHAYPLTSTWKAIQFVKTLPIQSGLLVREPYGEIISGYADIRAYIGGTHGFPDWLGRQWLAIQFFTGTYSEQDARKFLKDNDISYVFYGPDEQSVTTIKPLYSFLLTPVFTTDSAIVFKVNK